MKKNPNYKINDENYVAEKAYKPPEITSQIKTITDIMYKIEDKIMSQDLKAKITTFFRGINIE